MKEQHVTVILKNGFRYSGKEQKTTKEFYEIIDSSDNKRRKFPLNAISVVEVIE